MKPPPTIAEPPPGSHLPQILAAAHARHGPVFGVGSTTGTPTVFCIGPDSVREMFDQERAGTLRVYNTAAVQELFRRAVFTLHGAEHLRARSFLSTGLRHDAVTAYLPTIGAIAHRHVAQWATLPTIELYQAARDYTMAVCLAAILGLAVDDPIAQRVPDLFDRFVAGTELPPTRTTGSDPAYAAALAAAEELRALLESPAVRIEGRAESVTSKLVAAGHAPGGSLADHLLALLIAARETTASLVTWLLVECALDDQLATALTAEARSLVENPLQVLQHGAIPQLRHVLTECTRVHTPNTIATRRATTPVTLGGYLVPAGWHVAYSAPATHLLPQEYPDPEAFCPQRFRSAEGRRRAAGLLAFGRGPHACAGRGFAEATTLLLAAAVLAEHWIDLSARRPEVGRFQPVRAPAGPVEARIRTREVAGR